MIVVGVLFGAALYRWKTGNVVSAEAFVTIVVGATLFMRCGGSKGGENKGGATSDSNEEKRLDDKDELPSCKKEQPPIQRYYNIDQDYTIVPLERRCYYCCKEGKVHPIEHFTRYPCCGYYICLDCMWKNSSCCGECLTQIPQGNVLALPWVRERKHRTYNCEFRFSALIGRIFIYGAHMFVDELITLPVYGYKKLTPPSEMLAVLNPPNVQTGVEFLEKAAGDDIISAMLDLADVYCTNFANDPFRKDKHKAEQWYVRALGKENTIFPLAFTRYGDFLMLEQRYTEAKNMYYAAAMTGHTRGQYEYAVCLLEGVGLASREESNDGPGEVGLLDGGATNHDKIEGIQYLCKASEKGFYAPSYTALAKTLIEIAETTYGTVYSVGRSPLPRVLQILDFAKDCRYGTSNAWEEERSKLLERYESVKKKCSNCGQVGSKKNPLRFCGTCGVVAYCSNICQKRDYRDGHKFDCCSCEDLFNFESVKLTLPWVSKDGWKLGVVDMPRLGSNTEHERSVIQMVEDETDELYGEENQDYDEHVLTNLMLRMRINLETYLNQELQSDNRNLPPNLQNHIEKFTKTIIKEYPKQQDFVTAMHAIRMLGNIAAHSSSTLSDGSQKRLLQAECEAAVREYRLQKENFERYIDRIRIGEERIQNGDESAANVMTGRISGTNKDAKNTSFNAGSTIDVLLAEQPKGPGVVTSSSKAVETNEKANAQKNLAKCIADDDLIGIEEFLSTWKGVTGFADLRKKAKRAVKKIKERRGKDKKNR